MNPTREKAFDAAMTLIRSNNAFVDHEDAEDVLDMARRFECYLSGTDHGVESGADAEGVADKPWSNAVVTLQADVGTGSTAAPSPSSSGSIGMNGPGADAPTKGEDGRPSGEAQPTVKTTKSSKPRKVKAKAAKARKAKGAKKVTEANGAEASVPEVTAIEPPAEPAMEEAA